MARYHRLFGNKVLDFNEDGNKTSPFCNASDVFSYGGSKRRLPEGVYKRLIIVYKTNGIRRLFEAKYDEQDKLVRNDHEEEGLDGIEKLLTYQHSCLTLSTAPESISLNEFLRKSTKIPVLTDHLRTETMMNYVLREGSTKPGIKLSSNLLVNLFAAGSSSPVATFVFAKPVKIEDDIGVMGESVVQLDKHIMKNSGRPIEVHLSSLKTNATLVDAFDRIGTALQVLAINESGNTKLKIEDAHKRIHSGTWNFTHNGNNNYIDQSHSLEDVVERGYDLSLKETPPVEEDDYSSFVMLSEIKATIQWVPCNVIQVKDRGNYEIKLKHSGALTIEKRENILFSLKAQEKFKI